MKLVIASLPGDEFVVVAALNDFAILDNHDSIRIPDSREAVGNNEDRPAFHKGFHTLLDEALGTGINRTRGFIENHDFGVGNIGTGDSDELPLPLGEIGAVAGYNGVVPFRQAGDKGIRTRLPGGFDTFFIGGVEPAVADIFKDSTGKEVSS